jgi:holo-[acyl-carrier protein] synthase
MLRTGVDMIEIDRIRKAIDRYGEHFLGRVYTAVELSTCGGRYESLAARFAGKEAVAKALGTGVWRSGIAWTDIEIAREEATGAPVLILHAAAAARAMQLGVTEWSLSLSHDRQRAVAFVVGVGPV